MSRGNGTLGSRIRKARKASGFSQEDLGDGLGVTRSSVSLWEKNRATPEPEKMPGLAALLHVTPEYLAAGKGKPPEPPEPGENIYRRDMMNRMQRLIETGRFDDLIERRMYELIRSGKFDEQLAKLGYRKR